jgi:hypothetical protein
MARRFSVFLYGGPSYIGRICCVVRPTLGSASSSLNPPRQDRGQWVELIAALAVAKPPLKGLRQGSAQWLRPELRVQAKHLKAKGMLRHATVKQVIPD